MKRCIGLLAGAIILLGPAILVAEEGAGPDQTVATPTPTASTPSGETRGPEFTAEEKAEKNARKACKIQICDVLASKDPAGPDISCDIVKTWREATITKMLGGQIEWPWGKAVCQSRLDVKRGTLAKAMSEDAFEVSMPAQKLSCTLAQKEEGKPYGIEVSIAPKVAFEDGKAVKAELNWGEASGPMLVYALIYAGTGLDNSTNILGPQVVRMTNEFITKKCAEVRNELPGDGGN